MMHTLTALLFVLWIADTASAQMQKVKIAVSSRGIAFIDLYIAEDRIDIITANVLHFMACDLFSGPVKSDYVAAQVRSNQPAAHAFDDAVVEESVIGHLLSGRG